MKTVGSPTRSGTGAARTVLGDRGGRLADLTSALDQREQATLARLAGKLLAAAVDQVPDADRLCRLCDRGACVAAGATCPVGEACRARDG